MTTFDLLLRGGTVIDGSGRPGFPSDVGVLRDPILAGGRALASHLHQGYTTQLSGNCGESLAPLTARGREVVELSLRPNGLTPRWRTYGEYLEVVADQRLGPNVAFLVGHGTIRASVMGSEA